MTDRFKNAVDALVYAFFNDTLAKDICTACAVGNMVAWGFGKKLNPNQLGDGVYSEQANNSDWSMAFYTTSEGQIFNEESFEDPQVLECVMSTGFSIMELARVENAFERNTKIRHEIILNTPNPRSCKINTMDLWRYWMCFARLKELKTLPNTKSYLQCHKAP